LNSDQNLAVKENCLSMSPIN